MTDLTYYLSQKYFSSCQESMSFTMCFLIEKFVLKQFMILEFSKRFWSSKRAID